MEERLPGLFGSRYYGLYSNGHKVGYSHSMYGKDPATGDYLHENRFYFRTENDGVLTEFDSKGSRRWSATRPHAVLDARDDDVQGELRESFHLTRTDSGLVLTIDSGTEQSSRTVDSAEDLEHYVAAYEAVLSGEIGSRAEYLAISLRDGRDQRLRIELTAKEPTLADGVPLTSLTLTLARDGVDERKALRFDSSGVLLGSTIGDVIETRLESEERARALDGPVDLILARSVPAPGLPSTANRPTKVRLRWMGSGALLPERDFQRSAWVDEGSTQEVEVKQPEPPGKDERAARVPADVARHVAPDPLDCSDHPRIRALAKEITAGATDPWERALRINQWVSEYVSDSAGANATTALAVLDSKTGDCTEHTILASGLLRASGIPKRRVHGLMHGGPGLDRYYPHAWIEIWVGRWIPIDPTWDQAPADALHVFFGLEADVAYSSQAGMTAEVMEAR